MSKNPSTALKTSTLGRRSVSLLSAGVTLALAALVGASTSTQVKPLDPLVVPRTAHAATVLSDGRILITGGRDSSGNIVAVSEIFDPATATSTASATLTTPRVDHTATLLQDGRVLVAGGTGASGALNSAEIFDGAGFQVIPATMGAARAGHTATRLSDGTVLIAGGDAAGTAEIFDPTTGTFSSTLLNMAAPRTGHTATLFSNDNVLFAGGNTDSMELFSAAGQTFTLDSQVMSVVHIGQEAISLSDTRLLFVGGDATNTIEEFNRSTDTIATAATMAGASSSATLLANGNILVLGANMAGLYAPNTAAFSAFDEISVPGSSVLPRSGQTATELSGDKKIFVAGGANAQNLLQGAALFNPARIWTDKDDYQPGDNVILSGSGWKHNEDVYLYAVDDTTQAWTYGSTATADGNGGFVVDPYFVVQLVQDGANFRVTAVGAQSAMQADVKFTDSTFNSLTVGSQTGTATFGTGASVSYDIAANFTGNTTPNTVTFSFAWQGTPPAGVSNNTPASLTGPPNVLQHSSLTLTTSNTTPAGTYHFTVTGTPTSGSARSDTSGTLVVGKAGATVTLDAGSLSPTYDGNPHAATATTNPAGLAVTFTYNGSSTAPTNAGSYAVVATINDTNYSGSTTGTLVIAPAAPTVTVSFTPNTVTYDGNAHPATATATGVGGINLATGGHGTLSITYTPGGASAPVNASPTAYTASAHFTSSDNNYTNGDSPTPASLTINKATSTFSALTASQTISCGTATISLAGRLNNGGAGPTLTAPMGETVTITINGVSTISSAITGTQGNFSATVNTSALTAGTYPITYSYAGDSNFSGPVTNASTSVTVNSCNQPPVALCHDVTVSAGALCTANASIDNGSYDPDSGDTIQLSQSPAGPYALGTTPVTLTVTDNHGASSMCSATVTVNDTTPPVINDCPENITVNTGPGRLTCDQVATWTPPTASDNCSVGTPTANHNPGDTFPVGMTTVIYNVQDGAGNPATPCSFTVTVVDNTPPVITTCAMDKTILAPCPQASALVPDFTADVVASDNCGGVPTVTQTPAAGTQASLGNTTVTLHVKDTVGNETTCTAILSVHYDFSGFFQPVDNPVGNAPVYNRVKAGSAIPVKFSLGCYQGLNIMAVGFPGSATTTCVAGEPTDDVEVTVNAGGSSLNYDATANQYIYVWKTDKAWAGTCRVLNVKLADGTSHYAYFTFFK